MAIKRTKEQKQHAQAKRQTELVHIAEAMAGSATQATQFSYAAQKNKDTSVKINKQINSQENSVITQDLLKTIFVSVLLFSLLVGIYIYLRYN